VQFSVRKVKERKEGRKGKEKGRKKGKKVNIEHPIFRILGKFHYF